MAEPALLEDADVPTGTPPKLLLLEAGSQFEGMLVALRSARIEGCLRGALRAVGSLEIGSQAVVEGELDVGGLVVAGRIRGVIRARSTVELAASAVVEGEIHAPGVVIAEGSCVDARCRIDGIERPDAAAQGGAHLGREDGP